MRKIRILRSTCCGRDNPVGPGDIVEADPRDAAALVGSGKAEYYRESDAITPPYEDREADIPRRRGRPSKEK